MVDKRSDRLGNKNGLTHREFIKFVLGGLAAAVDGLLFGALKLAEDVDAHKRLLKAFVKNNVITRMGWVTVRGLFRIRVR